MNEETEAPIIEHPLQDIEKLKQRQSFLEKWRNEQISQMFLYPPILPDTQENS